jgi:hypothetical protein
MEFPSLPNGAIAEGFGEPLGRNPEHLLKGLESQLNFLKPKGLYPHRHGSLLPAIPSRLSANSGPT